MLEKRTWMVSVMLKSIKRAKVFWREMLLGQPKFETICSGICDALCRIWTYE